MSRKILLHVGCGRQSVETLPPWDFETTWEQVRVDIDPSVKPDIVASITDMGPVESESAHCVFSKHNIEHLEHHEVPQALAAFHRVLKPEGFLVLRCPDIQRVAELMATRGLEDTLYTASIYGKKMDVSLLDMIYGSRQEIAEGNRFMAHRTAFTERTLRDKILAAGFEEARVSRAPDTVELRCIALKRSAGNLFHTL